MGEFDVPLGESSVQRATRSARRGAYSSNLIASLIINGRRFGRVGTSAAASLRFKVAARRRR